MKVRNSNRIVFFSKAVYREPGTIPVHKHGCYELVYYLQGEGAIEISGVSYPFTRNTLSFSRPESWQIEKHENRGEVLFFGFEAQDAQELQEGVYADDSQLTMLKIVSDISQEVSRQQAGYEKMLSLKIEEMLIFLRRCGE